MSLALCLMNGRTEGRTGRVAEAAADRAQTVIQSVSQSVSQSVEEADAIRASDPPVAASARLSRPPLLRPPFGLATASVGRTRLPPGNIVLWPEQQRWISPATSLRTYLGDSVYHSKRVI